MRNRFPVAGLLIGLCLLQPSLSQEVDPTVRRCEDPNDIYLPPTATDTSKRLADLRNQMTSNNYHAYIVPTEDEHLSEYISSRDQRRVFITGFTGSAGTAVVTLDKAALWTDGRYFLQAERQLDCNWILMRTGQPGVPSIEEWVSSELAQGNVAAANPFVFSIDSWLYQSEYLSKSQIMFNQSFPDLIDTIWEDRPPPDGDTIFVYPEEYAGKSYGNKVNAIRREMLDARADYLFLTTLDEVAWLFNLRGNDLSFIPIFTSYALIGTQSIKLYANVTLLSTPELQEYLRNSNCQSTNICVDIAETTTARDDLLKVQDIVWMSSESTTYGMYSAVKKERQIQITSPVKMAKSIKNKVEIEGMKKAHVYDAVALCEYIMWLEKTVPDGIVDEISGAAKLKSLRLAQEKSKGTSFASISAVGANAAVIHYGSTTGTNKNLTTSEIYLIDSGGQYFEGTTDVTRTMHFGKPTPFEIEAFTRVLMGITDVELLIFPETLDGNDIDIIGRQHLFNAGLNFRHGTGHGVGHYLNIHEYPPGIGTAPAEGYPLQPGMFTSNEPGYYEDGKFGVRLENVVMVEEANTDYHFGEYRYLTLTTVTLVPFQRKLINATLLSDEQLNYINGYHARVMDMVGQELSNQGKSHVRDWLSEATKPIERSSADRSSNSMSLLTLTIIFFVEKVFEMCG